MQGLQRCKTLHHTARNGEFRGWMKVPYGNFNVKDLRRLENDVGERMGIRINCDTVSPPILSLLADAFRDEAKLSYKDMMEIVAEFLCSSSYTRRDIRILMMRLGVDDREMQADLIYMARSWRNRDPFTYVSAQR